MWMYMEFCSWEVSGRFSTPSLVDAEVNEPKDLLEPQEKVRVISTYTRNAKELWTPGPINAPKTACEVSADNCDARSRVLPDLK